MLPIMPENRKPRFSDQLMEGLQRATSQGATEGTKLIGERLAAQEQKKKALMDEEAENDMVERLTGKNIRGAKNPKMREQIVQELLKGQAELRKSSAANAAKEAEAKESNAGLKDALDWLEDNITYTGQSTIPGTKSFTGGILPIGREAIEKREEFDTTGFWAADQVFTRFNKGTVSKEKLNVILEKLAPNSELSERKNKARTASLRRMAHLPRDIPASVFNKELDKEIRALKKIESKSSKVRMRAPNGQIVPMEEDLVAEALERGWSKG